MTAMKQTQSIQQQVEKQLKIITKGASEIVSLDSLRDKLTHSLETGKPLTVKLGLDPSAPDLHLGHTVVLRKMKQLQDLGHHIVIIIGDFTGKIGDPTGKSKGRKALTDREVLINATTYTDQLFHILDREKTDVYFNGEWLELLPFNEVLQMASTITVARMLERDDFHNRFTNNTPIGLHEFFYPLMQAYDSVAIDADIEMGGTDQTFNILMGRTLQKSLEKEQQVAIFMPILEGLDGVEKMSKSLGNYIGIFEDARTMFKKCMEIPDALIIRYFELATDEHPDRIQAYRQALSEGKNPRDVKLILAHIITNLYHTSDETKNAEAFYQEAFTKKAIPTDIGTLPLSPDHHTIQDVFPDLVAVSMASSNGELRRLLMQGGIQINGEKITSLEHPVSSQDVLKIGKKRFLKLD